MELSTTRELFTTPQLKINGKAQVGEDHSDYYSSSSGSAAKNCRKHSAMIGVASSSQERAKSLLINGKLSDVKFAVPSSLHEGTTKQSKKMVIQAHRLLLAIISPVFYAMFCNA